MKIEEIKVLPKTSEGLFELNLIDENIFKAAASVYPIYMEFETEFNKKEGYMDIVNQIRILNYKLNQQKTSENMIYFLSMLIGTIEKTSPEIYEYYREMIDLFRVVAKKYIEVFWKDHSLLDNFEVVLFQETIRKACEQDILLTEKYEKYYL